MPLRFARWTSLKHWLSDPFLRETTMKFKSFIASCILTLPIAVSQSGSAAAQATCPCFSTVEVNQTTCEGSLRTVARKEPFDGPMYGEISMLCDLNNLPYDELVQLFQNDPLNNYVDLSASGPESYATSIISGGLFCNGPIVRSKRINTQQWQSCNQLLIDVSR